MKRKDRTRSPPTTRNIPELGISENKVRLGLPRIIQRKENAPEFDYSSFYAKTGAGDPLLCGGGLEDGETMVLQKNMFVENLLPGAILRRLSDDEMAAYRAPFANAGEDRRPTLTWPRQIPIEGEPPEVVRVATDCGRWLAGSRIPKLFINTEPGAILTGRQREFCRTWRNQTELTVKGIHFIQEDSPEEIGEGIAAFVRSLGSI